MNGLNQLHMLRNFKPVHTTKIVQLSQIGRTFRAQSYLRADSAHIKIYAYNVRQSQQYRSVYRIMRLLHKYG